MQLIAYYRVSTTRQGDSGLGLEAQRSKVKQLAAERGAEVVAEFVEVESGRKAERPQLAAALAEARKLKAVVAVAKLDRIARDAELLLRLTREATANATHNAGAHTVARRRPTTSRWRASRLCATNCLPRGGYSRLATAY